MVLRMALIFSLASNRQPYRYYYQPAVVVCVPITEPKKRPTQRGHSKKADCFSALLKAGKPEFHLISIFPKTISRE